MSVWCEVYVKAFHYNVCGECFVFGPQDVAVTALKTPPSAEYFGVQSLIWWRNLTLVSLAPVADAHNVVNMDLQDDQPFVLVTAYDSDSANLVINSLVESGIPSSSIILDVLPAYIEWYDITSLHPANDSSFDMIEVLARANGLPDSDASDTYLETTYPAYIVRSWHSPNDVNPLAYPGRKERGTNGTNTEDRLQEPLEQLRDNVVAAMEAEGYTFTSSFELEVYLPDDVECVTNSSYYPAIPNVPSVNMSGIQGCDRYSNDALYTMSPESILSGQLFMPTDRAFVAVGKCSVVFPLPSLGFIHRICPL